MKILRINEVMNVTSLSRATIYKLMGDGSFPSSVKLSPRSVGWLEDAVYGWVASLEPTISPDKVYKTEL